MEPTVTGEACARSTTHVKGLDHKRKMVEQRQQEEHCEILLQMEKKKT